MHPFVSHMGCSKVLCRSIWLWTAGELNQPWKSFRPSALCLSLLVLSISVPAKSINTCLCLDFSVITHFKAEDLKYTWCNTTQEPVLSIIFLPNNPLQTVKWTNNFLINWEYNTFGEKTMLCVGLDLFLIQNKVKFIFSIHSLPVLCSFLDHLLYSSYQLFHAFLYTIQSKFSSFSFSCFWTVLFVS